MYSSHFYRYLALCKLYHISKNKKFLSKSKITSLRSILCFSKCKFSSKSVMVTLHPKMKWMTKLKIREDTLTIPFIWNKGLK